MRYQTIKKREIKKYFIIKKKGKLFELTLPDHHTKAVLVNIPFTLNEDVARLAGMMPDGSLIKDLMRIYFHQSKDISKVYLFKWLLKRLFNPSSTIIISKGDGCQRCYINSKVLSWFFYYILRIPKSDEQMNVPYWVFNSPDSVKAAYLREAFAMEGTILKKLLEIRFITKDKKFVYNLQKLLLSLGITSHIKPRIGGCRRRLQYRLSIYRKENFFKFKQIGFNIPFHKERFQRLLKKYSKN